MSYGFEDRTDNTYLPNTPEGWRNFRWQLTSYTVKAVVVWAYYVNLEIEHRRNVKRQLEKAKDV